jgi:hypothetical protein
MPILITTAWKGGTNGYGLKLSKSDRDRYFNRRQRFVTLSLPTGEHAIANIDKPSFWNDTCRELICSAIGHWFLSEGIAPWPHGHPSQIALILKGEGEFEVTLASKLCRSELKTTDPIQWFYNSHSAPLTSRRATNGITLHW